MNFSNCIERKETMTHLLLDFHAFGYLSDCFGDDSSVKLDQGSLNEQKGNELAGFKKRTAEFCLAGGS